MNFIISSIVLLSIIMIIIYILSIDNNMDKVKNKGTEIFSVVKSKKINYLNEKDNKNLLLFIKQHFNSNDNIIIPSKIYYQKTTSGFEMNDVNIICYKYNNNKFDEIPYKINILFVPFEKDNYVSNQTLFGLYGNYTLNIIDNKKKSVQFSNKPDSIKTFGESLDTDILEMIPDNIQISETEDIISNKFDNDTTDTEELISHNLK